MQIVEYAKYKVYLTAATIPFIFQVAEVQI